MPKQTVQDILKTEGTGKRASQQANAQDRHLPTTGLTHLNNGIYEVSITLAVQHGGQYVCDAEVLSNGSPSGMIVQDIACPGFISNGAHAIMLKNGEGARIIPLGVGSAGAGGTTNNNTTIVYNGFAVP